MKNYKKAYKDVLNVIKELYPNMTEYQQEKLQGICPELAESEDERIRKEMLDFFCQFEDKTLRGVDISSWIAWLEKQGESRVNMVQWKGDNLMEVLEFTGKNKNFDKWFTSFEEFEKYVHEHNDIFKIFNEDGSHYEVPVGAWIVKTPDGYNVPSKAKYKQKIEQKPSWSEEDKNMFKWVIRYLNNKMLNASITEERTACKNAIDWLEKQGEQNPKHFELKAGHWYICHRAYCCRADNLTVKEGERFMCEEDGVVKGFVFKDPEKYFKEVCAPASIEDEQKPADKVEPKFKAGDFISDGRRVLLVLANKEERNLGETYSTYCEGLVLDVYGNVFVDDKDFSGFRLATDIERANFVHDLKVGTKINYKPTWSEEDEKILEIITSVLQVNFEPTERFSGYEEYANIDLINWLKALKEIVQPQPKQEWSEEDEKMVESCLLFVNANRTHPLATKCIDWLKSLKPNHWKPSAEQMKALERTVSISNFGIEQERRNALVQLLEELKKL